MQKDPNLRPKSQDLLKFKLFSLFPKIGGKANPTNNSQVKKPAWLILTASFIYPLNMNDLCCYNIIMRGAN